MTSNRNKPSFFPLNSFFVSTSPFLYPFRLSSALLFQLPLSHQESRLWVSSSDFYQGREWCFTCVCMLVRQSNPGIASCCRSRNERGGQRSGTTSQCHHVMFCVLFYSCKIMSLKDIITCPILQMRKLGVWRVLVCSRLSNFLSAKPRALFNYFWCHVLAAPSPGSALLTSVPIICLQFLEHVLPWIF